MRAKVYIGAIKYAVYIGRKIAEKTLEFLSLPAQFVSNKVQELKNFAMWGQSVQNGTPSPTNPIEIESVGDRTKNLLDKNNANWTCATDEYSYLTSNTGALGITKRTSAVNYPQQRTFYISCKPNTTYTLSKDLSTTMRAGAFDTVPVKDSVPTVFIDDTVGNNITITTGSTSKYLVIQLYINSDYPRVNWDVLKDNIQIEEGSTATSYEPYGYKIPVAVGSGKNLLDKNTSNRLNAFHSNSVYTPDRARLLLFVKVKPNTTYTLKRFITTSKSWNISQCEVTPDYNVPYKIDGVSTFYQIGTGSSYTFTTKAKAKYLSIAAMGSIQEAQKMFDTVMLVEGSVEPTSYEPYIEPTNIYLNEPLRKIGDYADYIDFEGQKVVRNVEVVDDTGTLPIEQSLRGLDTPTEESATLPAITLQQGTLTIDTDTKIKPSKTTITGDIDYVR